MRLRELQKDLFGILIHLQATAVMTILVAANDNSLQMKSSRTEIIKVLNCNELPHHPTMPRYNLTFIILVPYEEDENESDCNLAKVLPTIELAIRHVQQLGFGKVNFDVTLITRNSFCSSTFAPIGFFEIYSQWKDVNAIFGLCCSYVLAPISRYAGVWSIPVFSTGGRVSSFDMKQYYQTLTRLMGGAMETGRLVRNLLDSFNWTRSALLYEDSKNDQPGHSHCFHCIAGVHGELNNKSVYQVGFEMHAFHKNYIAMQLKKISTLARIVIMCGDPKIIREIMLTAEELNMIDSGEYVFINLELFSRAPYTASLPWYDKNDTDANNERAKKAFTAMLTITPKQPDDPEYIRVTNKIKAMATKEYNYTFHENDTLSEYVTSFYDGILLYASALNDSIKQNPDIVKSPIDGTEMVRQIWNRNINGLTGNVTIDGNGDRISAYSLYDMNQKTGHFEIVAQFFNNNLEYFPGKSIHWAGGRTNPPLNIPECSYDGSLCIDNTLPRYAILSLVLGVIVIVMSIGFIVSFRHYKAEAEINSMTWRVSADDVIYHESNVRRGGSFHSLVKWHGSQITVMSDDMISFTGDRQVFIPIGIYKGCKVAVKKINQIHINLNRSLMLQLKQMKDLQHDHLVKFYGACLDSTETNKFLLTEYCPKGSLQDILENDQFQLDWMFKLSLVHDIVRGMQFLHHSDIKSHGNLKSSNCVVDSRFVLKITDFGLHALRSSEKASDVEKCTSHAYWRQLLWTAPELLRMNNQPPEGTQMGDVYSFGIIVHEITTRQGPFYIGRNGSDKSPQEIIQLIMSYPTDLNQPFRPKIDNTTNEDINNLMQKCWSEEPTERPDFQTIKASVRKINKNNETGNIVDNLLKRMEQYANNLEELVEERTQDYIEEKKKCEKLLYQLLPQSVAAQLIRGQAVVAETFDQVTIYFSDIVGFTAISAESTPLQVVQFLNDLYTCFDSIVENFDVYKVETIGDAYMVVSGLPLRNGDQHPREIARLALALLEAVYNFKIHHRPNDQLRLRIGLHTGPCVAGVVGLKMPRYCLFGDTVNTASRMESNGEALKIHISQTTKTSLDQFGTFITRKRGFVPMKGKGEMLTYWLEGEKNISSKPTQQVNPICYSRRSSLKLKSSLKQNSSVSEISYCPPLTPPLQSTTNSLQHKIQYHTSFPSQVPVSKRRKISSSSPKLNEFVFKTEDNNNHNSDFNQRRLSKDFGTCDDVTDKSVSVGMELTNFRLPLAALKKLPPPSQIINHIGHSSTQLDITPTKIAFSKTPNSINLSFSKNSESTPLAITTPTNSKCKLDHNNHQNYHIQPLRHHRHHLEINNESDLQFNLNKINELSVATIVNANNARNLHQYKRNNSTDTGGEVANNSLTQALLKEFTP